MLEKGVIEPTEEDNVKFIRNLFLRAKKDGTLTYI